MVDLGDTQPFYCLAALTGALVAVVSYTLNPRKKTGNRRATPETSLLRNVQAPETQFLKLPARAQNFHPPRITLRRYISYQVSSKHSHRITLAGASLVMVLALLISMWYFTPGSTPATGKVYIKAASIGLNIIKPGTDSYQANWVANLKNLNINTIRLVCGGEGDIWHINMIQNPNTWAQNLESLLAAVDSAGFKCYFYSLGDPWGGELGINDQDPDIPSTISVAQAKVYLEELAGNNALGHNFLSDPRVAMWSVANEVNFGDPSNPNANYGWVIAICDYIRSKGGVVTVPYARLYDEWDQYLPKVAPMLVGHVDYLETHDYGIWQLANQYSLGNKAYDWAAWENWLYDDLKTSLAGIGSFDMDHVLLGEFGIWRGVGTGQGLTHYDFTDQNRVDYYTHYFNVIKKLGLKNLSFWLSIEENAYYGEPEQPRFGMITPVPDNIHFFDPAGQPYPGYDVIKLNYK